MHAPVRTSVGIRIHCRLLIASPTATAVQNTLHPPRLLANRPTRTTVVSVKPMYHFYQTLTINLLADSMQPDKSPVRGDLSFKDQPSRLEETLKV
jgi:hypothetical protein